MTWIEDENGNRCSIERWGSEEKAREALAGNRGCSGCSDCSGCTDCSRCSDCTDCSGCTDCSDCSRCSGCSRCSRCSECSYCSRCYDCYDCSGCSGCSVLQAEEKGITVPVVANLHEALYAAVSKPEALDMTSWHTCDTTHCRAGWVTKLAGAQGKALEQRFGTLLAAMMIYDESCPDYKINPCRFFDDDRAAMEDMRKLAEQVTE